MMRWMNRLGMMMVLAMGGTAVGDELVLSDGSRLQGRIESYYNGKVKIMTGFAGEMNIDATMVEGVASVRPMMVQMKGGEQYVGVLHYGEGGQQVAGKSAKQFKMEEVEVIRMMEEEGASLEEGKKKPVAEGWSLRLELGLDGQTGTSEHLVINGRAQAKRTTEMDRLTFYVMGRYSTENGRESAQEIIGGADYEYDLSERWFLYGKLEGENDKFENLEFRMTAVGGVGYFVVKDERVQWKVKGGPGFQHESFEDGNNREQAVLEVGEELRWDVADWLTLTHGVNYYPTFEGLEDFRVVMENAGEVPLSAERMWKLKVGVRTQYKSQPSGDADQLDTYYFLNVVTDLK